LILQLLKEYIWSDFLKENSRMSIKNFIRERVLTFPVVLLFFISLAKNTLQISLNSFLESFNLPTVTKQAFIKARRKISERAFILLNRKLLEEYYTDNEYSTWRGFRLIAIDGSDIQVPQKKSLKSCFGCAKNNKGETLAMAKLSCAYDILNNKTLDAQIDRCKSSERDLAVENIEAIKLLHHDETKDLYVMDRGYPSLGFFFYLKDQKKDFVVRGSFKSCFSSIERKLQSGCTDFTHRLYASDATPQQKQELKKRVPLLDRKTSYIDLRVTVVTLDNNQKELLFSSLIDQELYLVEELKKVYGLRWSKEENYKWYKIGMELEDFSGYSELGVEQEVWATVFTANVSSLVMQEAQEEIDEEHSTKQLKHRYKINKRIAIGSMKDKLVKVLFDEKEDISSFCANLKEVLKKNICPIREGRKYERVRKNRRKYGCTQRRCM